MEREGGASIVKGSPSLLNSTFREEQAGKHFSRATGPVSAGKRGGLPTRRMEN